MKRPKWLQEVEALLPEILGVAKQCDEPFQQKCFELLLTHALKDTGVSLTTSVAGLLEAAKAKLKEPKKGARR